MFDSCPTGAVAEIFGQKSVVEDPRGGTNSKIGRGFNVWPVGSRIARGPSPRVARNAAVDLAARGFRVLPVSCSKEPTCPSGFKAAANDPDEVERLWREHPGPLVGVATGEASGVDVLDLDKQHGAAEWWERNRDRIPATRTHRTRSGGLHLIFRHQVNLRNSVGRIGAGVDVRADGGYAIWWPAAGLDVLCDFDPVDWPPWLVRAATPQPVVWREEHRHNFIASDDTQYVTRALASAYRKVSTAAPGTRNRTLNNEAFCLARFILMGQIDAHAIEKMLTDAALSAGLEPIEIAKTIKSALSSRIIRGMRE